MKKPLFDVSSPTLVESLAQTLINGLPKSYLTLLARRMIQPVPPSNAWQQTVLLESKR